VLEHARLIVGATEMPVSLGLEKLFGDAPEAVAETVFPLMPSIVHYASYRLVVNRPALLSMTLLLAFTILQFEGAPTLWCRCF
jgi:hypothetical protein